MNLRETTRSSQEIYRGRIVRFQVDEVTLPDGNSASREVVRHYGGVCVAPLTDQNELLFVRQFRYPYDEVLWELPAGKLEQGEDPEAAGLRELQEETGATTDKLIPMGKLYPSPGYCDEIIHLYMARVHAFGAMHPDEDEFLEVERLPLNEAVRRVMNHEIRDAKTQVLILKLAMLNSQQ